MQSIQQQRQQHFTVHNKSKQRLKLIPYIGCKSGFAHIFDVLIPNNFGKKIYDVFGGGGGFTFYACNRFGSKNVMYNDHNPVLTNLMECLKKYPEELYAEYQEHYRKSSSEYYLHIRKQKGLDCDVKGAGRFFYLSKNAFSGKIRFNSKNEFNVPMRKNTPCPKIDIKDIVELSETIKYLTIKNKDFKEFQNVNNGLVYLDPPYMNNTNGHYNATVKLDDFIKFVKKVQNNNKVMISEQNTIKELGLLSESYKVFSITLQRSLQYITQSKSKEIIAINYN